MVGTEDSRRQAPSCHACLVEAELRARAAYSEPGRHYHGPAHLDDCLEQLDAVHGLDDRERRILRWALLWHDAVYDARRSDNEQRSAQLARRELLACAADEPDADEVARLILLTRRHRVEPGDRLGALLVSIDLSVLGADPAAYRAYAEGVRREHAHVPEGAWKAGRAALLEHMLAADPLYPDPAYAKRLESAARRNMEQELSSLRAG